MTSKYPNRGRPAAPHKPDFAPAESADEMQYWGHAGGDAEWAKAFDAWLAAHPTEKPYRYAGELLCVHAPEGKQWASPGDWLVVSAGGVRVKKAPEAPANLGAPDEQNDDH